MRRDPKKRMKAMKIRKRNKDHQPESKGSFPGSRKEITDKLIEAVKKGDTEKAIQLREQLKKFKE